MTATLLKAADAAARIKADIKKEVAAARARGVVPQLGVVFAGDSGASAAYLRSKVRMGTELDIVVDVRSLPGDASEAEVAEEVGRLSLNPGIHGVMVELPLPKHVNPARALAEIDPVKDVDGVHLVSRGMLLRGNDPDALEPVTPLSCLALLEEAGISPSGRNVAVVGRGETVGLPLAVMLVKKSATVTVCHSRTANLAEIVSGSDIVFTAAGKPGLVDASMLRPGQTVIDAGISVLPGGKIAGDVDPRAVDVVAKLSPVPGGVGSLTTVLIFRNLMKAVRLQKKLGPSGMAAGQAV
ncbi:MAG: bifunctional 5,10-methylenetetrahydrofolate dehydrogenase/5,10-methenyltetrahydrofolate cyclohydrolase [Deltaproteobacteria bacterium]|jgi:methylenetetrahydrofolate dehydrogenase (NADP+)/methenyltetrahydrofolate cyclohydrolase|nr:bifunctional 5,10-methylenetetrahydrofolate dehydrogenase/5,10-methenyltetrahydrofolate cyclohydrolase [Deltaproteobacteria bacterium]